MPRKVAVNAWNRIAPASLPGERRTRRRYALNLDLSYRIQEGTETIQSGSGTTCDLSSTGIRFTTREKLSERGLVEITMAWPKVADHGSNIILRVSGRVVRNEGTEAVIRMEKHEFFASNAAAPLSR